MAGGLRSGSRRRLEGLEGLRLCCLGCLESLSLRLSLRLGRLPGLQLLGLGLLRLLSE